MRLRTIIGALTILLIGMTLGAMTATPSTDWTNLPDGTYEPGALAQVASFNPFATVKAVPSPKDRIPERAIAVYNDRIELDIKHAEWATFTDTHSMEPVIMAGANAIELAPASMEDLQVGDICSYKSEYAEGSIIHRIVYKGQDEDGAYVVFKGDNLATSDPGRVRFDQIERCVVAIVY